MAARGKKPTKKRGVEERATRIRIDGAKLRALRQDAELSIRELAYAVDVDPKTITDLEAGRREWSHVRVIRSIAAHPSINVAWEELTRREDDHSNKVSSTPFRPVTSSLDVFVHAEKRGAALPPLETSVGMLPSFGATQLANIFSSPLSRAGEQFYTRGQVVAHRGLPSGDGNALGIDAARGSRFMIARRVGQIDRPLSFTVFTTTVEATKALQLAWERDQEIVIAISIVAIERIGETIRVSGQSKEQTIRPIDRKTWSGFHPIVERDESGKSPEAKPHPWLLQVLSVEKI